MGYMTEEDWAEFSRRFPSAESFIIARNLQREFECLKAELERLRTFEKNWFDKFPTHTHSPDGKRLAWVELRVADLTAHYASIAEVEAARRMLAG